MSRVQRFREIRYFRIKIIMAVLFFILVLCVGIGATDYSMSGLIGEENGFRIFSAHPYGEDYYKISIFDNDVYINTKYIARDYNRLTDWFGKHK
ncbi:hypothetical protein [Acetivibrio cellulolyticus]|uniref:hypothetical protein n=1 Tax=Acetivibrio cellulolyticus TaxID=35830 RepID=UPI0001E2C6C5|nr:hypothetical protein [Acetivibrio cellulolyticus]